MDFGLNTVLGVELNLLGNQLYRCSYCLLEKKNESLHIESTKVMEGNLTSVLEKIPKKYPVALNLTGKGLIQKNWVGAVDQQSGQVFQAAFPSVDQKDFYIQEFREDTQFLISIIRREVADQLLDKLNRAGLRVYTLSLGAMVTWQIWSQLNIATEELVFDGHLFSLNAKKFNSYSYLVGQQSEAALKVADQKIEEEVIAAYASAFQLILHDKLTLIVADVTQINANFHSFLNNEKIKSRAFIFLVSLFVLLLISYGVFAYYNGENARLAQQVGAQTATADQSELMKKNIAENEFLLKQLNWNGGYSYAFLLDELARKMPKQLTLKEVSMNEFKTEIEKAERVPSIKVVGTTDNLTAVNNWIFMLKEASWLKSVRLLKYEEDQEASDYRFDLLITY